MGDKANIIELHYPLIEFESKRVITPRVAIRSGWSGFWTENHLEQAFKRIAGYTSKSTTTYISSYYGATDSNITLEGNTNNNTIIPTGDYTLTTTTTL